MLCENRTFSGQTSRHSLSSCQAASLSQKRQLRQPGIPQTTPLPWVLLCWLFRPTDSLTLPLLLLLNLTRPLLVFTRRCLPPQEALVLLFSHSFPTDRLQNGPQLSLPHRVTPLCNPLTLSMGRICDLLLTDGLWPKWWAVTSMMMLHKIVKSSCWQTPSLALVFLLWFC